MTITGEKCQTKKSNCNANAGPVVICGAGAAGMGAAISAARSGTQVYLMESTARPGGTVAAALIHTLAGFYDSYGHLLQQGLGAELIDRLANREPTVLRRRMGRLWVLSVCPNVYRDVVEEWIACEPNITLLTDSQVDKVICEERQVTQLEISGRHGNRVLWPQAVIDTTGMGDVVRLIDHGLLQTDARPSAAGLIFRMRGVAPGTLNFPNGVGLVKTLRMAAAERVLPSTCAHAWIDRGLHEDEVFVKLFVPLSNDWREHRYEIEREAKAVQGAVVGFLTKLPQFSRASVVQSGRLGIRDGGRMQGEYCLTVEDVRQMRKFEDAACRCCWPIEYWDATRGVSLEYLPQDGYYEIPLRALKLKGFDNVWMAGKCLSADAYAQASARVVGSCWAMGEAVGKVAAVFRRQPTTRAYS